MRAGEPTTVGVGVLIEIMAHLRILLQWTNAAAWVA
jgi:hypothetical protein